MKTYSVKQIAEMLGTNPETVRRWIRDEKLTAVQVSRKNGNIVTEAELKRFLKATPKYFSKLTAGVGLAAISPAVGIGALAGGIMASAVLGIREVKNGVDVRVRPEDFESYLRTSISKLHGTIKSKQELLRQTEAEIEELSNQIKLYTSLLKTIELHDEISDQIKQYSSLLDKKELLENTLDRPVVNKEE